MQEPFMMPCSHSFCKGCITQAIGQRGRCPCCKAEGTRRNLVPNEQMTRFIKYYKDLLSTEEHGFLVRACGAVALWRPVLIALSVFLGAVLAALQLFTSSRDD